MFEPIQEAQAAVAELSNCLDEIWEKFKRLQEKYVDATDRVSELEDTVENLEEASNSE